MVMAPERDRVLQYVGGKWVGAADGSTYLVHNPSTGEPLAEVAAGDAADAAIAVGAARDAFDEGSWRNMSQEKRSLAMIAVAEHLAEVCDDWAFLESANGGATIRKTAVVDVPMAIEHFRSLAEQAMKISWYEPLPWVDIPAVSWNFVQREPIGICAGIIPWNYPLMMAVWKIAPAIAMGNSVVLKPSPFTPLTAARLVAAIDETGIIPKGVINLVTGPGPGLGEALVTDTRVDKVAFTGSTATGRKVLAGAAETIKKVTLELGGKSASIVCPDADLELAVDGVLFGTFFHQGQMCEAGTRVYVHAEIYEHFVEMLVAKARGLKVGNATDPESQLGPIINETQHRNIKEAVRRAVADGGRVLCGGGEPSDVPEGGHYLEPTVIANLPDDASAACDEIFGPVVSVFAWKELGDVISRANRSIYGLAGGVWSKDTRGAIEIARQLRTGTVWINDWHLINALAPFGGYRQSGLGRELGSYGLLEYTEVKHIHVDQNTGRQDRFAYDILLGS